jgi:hypothetical protein
VIGATEAVANSTPSADDNVGGAVISFRSVSTECDGCCTADDLTESVANRNREAE